MLTRSYVGLRPMLVSWRGLHKTAVQMNKPTNPAKPARNEITFGVNFDDALPIKDGFQDLARESRTPSKNFSAIADIDELLRDAPGTTGKLSQLRFHDLGQTLKDPKDVARNINIMGPAAGRSVDVRSQNVSAAIKKCFLNLKQNNFRQQLMDQKRYIRPAKFRKEKKRRWWRRHFALKFSDLMEQIVDAKRRGY